MSRGEQAYREYADLVAEVDQAIVRATGQVVGRGLAVVIVAAVEPVIREQIALDIENDAYIGITANQATDRAARIAREGR